MRIDRVKLATELARREMRSNKLAEISGVSRTTVSAIHGGKSISSETANRIALALNIPVEQLVERGKYDKFNETNCQ